MAKMDRDHFLRFAEGLYLKKLMGSPISGETRGWAVGINDCGIGRYNLEAMDAHHCVARRENVHGVALLGVFGEMYDELADHALHAPVQPIKYEDLNGVLQENLKMGHILAAHMVEDEDGMRAEHMTTVQIIAEDIPTGAPVYYCNDVCGDECELGSVRLLMVQMPKGTEPNWETIGLDTRVLHIMADPDKQSLFISEVEAHWAVRAAAEASAEASRSVFEDSVYLDEMAGSPTKVSPLEELSLLLGKSESLTQELTEFQGKAEAAFAAQERLNQIRQFKFNHYREAIITGRRRDTGRYAHDLFMIETGMKPDEDYYTFGRFVEFLHDAVMVYDAETPPEFLPEDGDSNPDCGG